MLELKNIRKDYITSDTKVSALKGISIDFRKHEFVSILGPSGCGKTTLLNIIGGLDDYTKGDLIINGKSTKKYTDKDWDTYRNHNVGFVFQSYNLIPHQTVLANVELALTLSGVNPTERRKRAKKVLEEVGLKDQIYKKPNQLSGGQMQRVAIARALVNDPDILLADEPTGALDSKTSVQIMEILKSISKDKLIIMVTHNPELAETYSSRIIKLLDGDIVSDSKPFENKEKKQEEFTTKGKKSMSIKTALSLSLNNLMTKKGRTFLTSFAGSIGIIGIALIMSLSTGVQNYIDSIEEDTLSTYPISIYKQTVDMSSMMVSMMGMNESKEHDFDKIYTNNIMNNIIETMSNQVQTNDLHEFKNYIEESNLKDYTNAIQYGYNITLNIYNADYSNGIIKSYPNNIYESLGIDEMMGGMSVGTDSATYMQTEVFEQLLDNEDLLHAQYDLLSGSWPKEYNEVVLIVDENNEISDYTLYSLGVGDTKPLKEAINKILTGQQSEFTYESESTSYEYSSLLDLKFKLVLSTDYYQKSGNVYVDKTTDEEYIKNLIDNGLDIKIVGIIKPNEERISGSSFGSIGYTKDLVDYAIEKTLETNIAKEQLANQNINILTGLEFDTGFDINNLTNEQKYYLSTLSQEELLSLMSSMENATYENNLSKLGIVDKEYPSSINIYPKDFESKEEIQTLIENYNKDKTDNNELDKVINYTDIVGLMMESVTSVVNVISYVLIAFVAISLVVSSIMIGIITYISVLERTKEIGILRAIGASKKDVSRVFNAETMIIGLVSGTLGIIVTLILNVFANIILKQLVGINVASLPLGGAIILVIISVSLTLIAGLIPSKIASKKDPVEALRTE